MYKLYKDFIMGLTDEQIAERDESLKRLNITTYKDKAGYVFVSYKSDNWKTVFEDKIFGLQEEGLRVYSDKNFNDTNHPWLDDMDKNIKYASAVLMFISCDYLKSYATLIELLTAIKYKKEIVPIYFSKRDSLFEELEDDVDLEDDIIKMEPSEAKKLETLLQISDGKYGESIKKIWNNCSDKFSAQKFCVMNIVDAFKVILTENGFKDNLFSTSNESLKNTINDACSLAKYSVVFDNQRAYQVQEEVAPEESKEEDLPIENPPIEITQPICPIYYIKGAKYEAYLTNEDDKYTVLKGSKIAENWREWAGAKNIELHVDKVDENCIMLEDATFNSVSAVAKFVKGTSTDGGGVFVEKNLVTEIKPISLSERIGETADSDVKKKSASVTGDIKYTLYGKEYEENQAKMMLRIFAQVLKRHQDKVSTLPEQDGMNCAMKYDEIQNPNESSAYPTYFRSCRNFTFENGESVCIGTAYSSGDKMKKIARLFDICEEDRDVFYSEQVEIPETVRMKAASTHEGSSNATSSNRLNYTVYGQTYSGDQTDMMTTVCSKIIEKHPEKLSELVDGTLCIAYKNDAVTMEKSYFRVIREFTCEGKDYVVGTAFGLGAKVKEIEKVLRICGEDFKSVQIEGYELNEKAGKGRGKSKDEEDFLAD